jgi:dolichyl-phosphate beta-glucosyltransferase
MPPPPEPVTELRPEISVVIPAFNEAGRIRHSLEEVLRYLAAHFIRYEVIVVDDGSTDGTLEAAQGLGSPAVRCLRNEANSGKGASVRRGILDARHDPILFTDADLATPIGELERLLEPLDAGFDGAIASRRMPESRVRRSTVRRLLGWGFGHLVRCLAVDGFQDTQCGFKVFRRRAAEAIFPLQTIDRWGFDVEILAIAGRLGLRIAEVGVTWRQSGDTRMRLGAPFEMAGELCRIRRNLKSGLYEVGRRTTEGRSGETGEGRP